MEAVNYRDGFDLTARLLTSNLDIPEHVRSIPAVFPPVLGRPGEIDVFHHISPTVVLNKSRQMWLG